MRAYPKYKDSGVEWLGVVPEHWEVSQMRRLLDLENGADHKTIEVEEGYPVIGSGGQFAYASDYMYDGESVLLGRKGTIDRPLHVTGRFWTVDTMYWSMIRSGTNGRFAFHAATTIPFAYYSTSTALPSMTKGAINGHRLALPPISEQAAIAAFLDRETAKIDALVAEQRRLIELLTEKRRAVISHAVTKGLDPDAPMKPSGIDWLGEVPEHWETIDLKHLVAVPITDGPHETPEFIDEGVAFVSAEAVSSGLIDFSKIRGFISEADNNRYSTKYSPRLHDIYMVKSGATTGVTAIVDGRTDFNIWSPLAAIRCGKRVNPYFVLQYLRSQNFLEAVELGWSFGTQQNIGMCVIENLACPVPPLPEQAQIVQCLNRQLGSFVDLIASAERAIGLLLERRTALISAAVTGKIDVRGAVPAEKEEVTA